MKYTCKLRFSQIPPLDPADWAFAVASLGIAWLVLLPLRSEGRIPQHGQASSVICRRPA